METQHNLSFLKRFVFSLITFIILFVLMGLVAEAIMRIVNKPLSPPYNNKEKDVVLGWRAKEGYTAKELHALDRYNVGYIMDITFGKNGFRLWNSTGFDSLAGTVFFLGDSYVESLESSDDSLFYSIFKSALPFKVYAYGTAGYGTTQELMILQKYVDSIKPNWVVLEVCNNDFIDNYWGLELASNYKVGERRPYLTIDNRIEYHHPLTKEQWVKQYSLFLNFLLKNGENTLENLHLRKKCPSAEDLISEQELGYPLFNTSYYLTSNSLDSIKKLLDARGIKLLVFVADDFQPSTKYLNKICSTLEIETIPGVADSVRAHENLKEHVRAWDNYHWAHAGQKIVAREIISYFRKKILQQAN